jgi:hypothetical protein
VKVYTVISVRELKAMLKVAEEITAERSEVTGLTCDPDTTCISIHSRIKFGWENEAGEQNCLMGATVNGRDLLNLAYGNGR